ncbi:hypothetical protein GOBAR_AA34956 [Gossypium barbadense]|uniref:Uncharacterized protein n=1 Tax=Gossypium barbadense TaxID=3634 RepID=A0A2P5W3R6_GOSBA|nr:hypothetical protein GOBAR_AA34956 [Gossypium barbadense]
MSNSRGMAVTETFTPQHDTLLVVMSSSFTDWQSAGDFGCTDNYTRKDDVLPTTSTCEGTFNPELAKGLYTQVVIARPPI